MVEFEFLDETFDINSAKSYHMSIQAGLDGLSFCILDPLQNKYIALKNYPNSLKQEADDDWFRNILTSDEFLSQEYKSSAVIFSGHRSTLVPEPLFKKDHLKDYFQFNLNLEEHEEIRYNLLNRADAWTLYPVSGSLLELFNNRFTGLKCFHHSIPFLNSILLNQKNGARKSSVYVNIHGGIFDIAVTRAKNLTLYNCFPYTHVTDLMYFVLNVFNQLTLTVEDTTVFLSGKISRQSSFYENLRRYIKKIEFAKRDRHYTYSYTFEKLPDHAFLNLLNLYSCVS